LLPSGTRLQLSTSEPGAASREGDGRPRGGFRAVFFQKATLRYGFGVGTSPEIRRKTGSASACPGKAPAVRKCPISFSFYNLEACAGDREE
jgi:hypothetical protein